MPFPKDISQLQELVLVVEEKFVVLNKILRYALIATLVLMIPLFFVFRSVFFNSIKYSPPPIVYQKPQLESLQVLETKVLQLSANDYSGYVRIRNINLEWGVANQPYTASFKTLGGTEITKVTGQTFILPSSEKLVVFSRFTANVSPAQIDFNLNKSHFVHQPILPQISFPVSRIEFKTLDSQFILSAVVSNFSPYTVRTIGLPVLLYDNRGQAVGVNFTNINDVKPSETRSFQFFWPSSSIKGVLRAEVRPEVNIFDRLIFTTEQGKSPFDNIPQSQSQF